MRKEQVAHVWRAIFRKQFQCLVIGHVSVIASDPVLEVNGIPSIGEKILVVIRFEECCVALLKVFYHVLTRTSYIGEHANFHLQTFYDKTLRIRGIMQFRKSCD